ncbi:MAG: hypothetical protein WAX77_07160 [Methylococcaceae bacterium]
MKKILIILPLLLSACAYEVQPYLPSVTVTPPPRPRPYYPNTYQQPNYNYQPYSKPRYERHGDSGHHNHGRHKGWSKHEHDD